ncbi:hypothetical protein [Paraburkholderia caffeinilytica]|uniref:hypothetical protein n=1 Tax=Paraburkholderia caffeinilytica TaxID=1761016 RepID=UPI003DA0E21A
MNNSVKKMIISLCDLHLHALFLLFRSFARLDYLRFRLVSSWGEVKIVSDSSVGAECPFLADPRQSATGSDRP